MLRPYVIMLARSDEKRSFEPGSLQLAFIKSVLIHLS